MSDLADTPVYPNSFGAPAGSAIDGGRVRVKISDNDTPGAAGNYYGAVTQPAGSVLVDVILTAVALWDAGTSATGTVGIFGGDTDGVFTGINMKATDLLAGESISTALAGGKAGAFIAGSQFNSRYATDDREILLTIATVGTSTTGETIMDVLWYFPTRGEIEGFVS